MQAWVIAVSVVSVAFMNYRSMILGECEMNSNTVLLPDECSCERVYSGILKLHLTRHDDQG